MKFIPSHVSFIDKSNTENCIKIRCVLTKLQTKISWLLFMAHCVCTYTVSQKSSHLLTVCNFVKS